MTRPPRAGPPGTACCVPSHGLKKIKKSEIKCCNFLRLCYTVSSYERYEHYLWRGFWVQHRTGFLHLLRMRRAAPHRSRWSCRMAQPWKLHVLGVRIKRTDEQSYERQRLKEKDGQGHGTLGWWSAVSQGNSLGRVDKLHAIKQARARWMVSSCRMVKL